jgi:5-methylcytosine-specific restriction endonuclease McrBC regulatory subunit McrC
MGINHRTRIIKEPVLIIKTKKMKTLSANNGTKNFDSFSFDVLTAEELSLVKGGKSQDSYPPLD